jgi:hypothetical protein
MVALHAVAAHMVALHAVAAHVIARGWAWRRPLRISGTYAGNSGKRECEDGFAKKHSLFILLTITSALLSVRRCHPVGLRIRSWRQARRLAESASPAVQMEPPSNTMSFKIKPELELASSPGVVNKKESVVRNMMMQNALPAADTTGKKGRSAIAIPAATSNTPKKIDVPCTPSGP